MIDAKDLRIGNIIDVYGRTSVIKQITDAEFKGIRTNVLWKDKGDDCSLSDFMVNPIELSESWLIKFGFEKRKTNLTYFIKDGFTIIKRVTEFAFDVGTYDIAVRHVHQLQNLFYALCGTDLELHP